MLYVGDGETFLTVVARRLSRSRCADDRSTHAVIQWTNRSTGVRSRDTTGREGGIKDREIRGDGGRRTSGDGFGGLRLGRWATNLDTTTISATRAEDVDNLVGMNVVHHRSQRAVRHC